MYINALSAYCQVWELMDEAVEETRNEEYAEAAVDMIRAERQAEAAQAAIRVEDSLYRTIIDIYA